MSVVNQKEIQPPQGKLRIFMAPCPLYSQGSLGQTDLIVVSPSQIQDANDAVLLISNSRVGNKQKGYESVIAAMASGLPQGIDVELTVAFADMGVLLARHPTESDLNSLAAHRKAYQLLLSDFCLQQKINPVFTAFSDYASSISLPQFTDPREQVEGLSHLSAEEVSLLGQDELKFLQNTFIALLSSRREQAQGQPVINNKDTQKAAGDLIKSCGTDIAYLLAEGYAFTDPLVPQLVGDEGVYAIAERLGPLHRMVKFTPQTRQMTRLEIKA